MLESTKNAARHAGEVLFGFALGTLYLTMRTWGEIAASRAEPHQKR